MTSVLHMIHLLDYLVCLERLNVQCYYLSDKNGINFTLLFLTFETQKHFIQEHSVTCLYFTFEYKEENIETSLQQVGNHANIYLTPHIKTYISYLHLKYRIVHFTKIKNFEQNMMIPS